MTFTLVCNGILIAGDKFIENGAVLYDEKGIIRDVGDTDEVRSRVFRANEPELHLKIIDAKKRVIMPGFICTHHHLYSTFARGMYLPGKPARNFVEILEKLWWRLDKTLHSEDIYWSALVALIECIRNGVTTIIDHHESQTYQVGSLDDIKRAVEKAGIRATLCFGTSDRYGKGKEGLDENERFLDSLSDASPQHPYPLVAGMVGLHASFTVNDDTLSKSVELAKKFKTGIHIHCAEDKADQKASLKKYKMRVVERLNKAGALGEKTILGHCIHLTEKELSIIKKTKTNVVHNPESNMNNAVGCADVLKMLKKGILVGLGTDGMSSDMLAQMRCAYLLQRHFHRDPRVAFNEAPGMLLDNNRVIASRIFGFPIGDLKKGAPADLIILDYYPPTPLTGDNFYGHLIFGMVDAAVDTVIVNGRLIMRERTLSGIDENYIAAKSREVAEKFWKTIRS